MRAGLLAIIAVLTCGCGQSVPNGDSNEAIFADAGLADSADASASPDAVADAVEDALKDTGGGSDTCQSGGKCEKHNEFGTCSGVLGPCVAGQATCSATVPAPETCNGKDDDCNGVTDDNLCEDGDPATIGYCDGSKCAQKPVCKDCTIGSACVAAGTLDPGDKCKVCNPLQSKTGYVPQNGLNCDDGDACTTADTCKNGKCAGTAMDCSGQAGACGAASCVGGKCVVTGTAGACKPGDIGACSDPCETKLCGADCQWQACGLKAGASCAYQAGSNHQCCAPGSWQFCSKLTCNWYPCQADAASGCP